MDELHATTEQNGLAIELTAIRSALQRYAAQIGLSETPDEATPVEADDDPSGLFPALDQVCATFGLSSFERALLLLCAGIELDGTIAALCAAIAGDHRRIAPTFRLALAALPNAHWSALSPDRPLRRWRMIEVGQGEALVHCPLRIEERVLHHLLGVTHLEPRLRGLLTLIPTDDQLQPSLLALAAQATETLTRSSGGSVSAGLLIGADATARRTLAASICEQLGLMLWCIQAEDIPHAPVEIEALARLWEREAALAGAALLIECGFAENRETQRAATRLCDEIGGLVLVSGAEQPLTLDRPTISVDLPSMADAERGDLWRAALGPAAATLNGTVDRLTAQFQLSPRAIRAAGREVLMRVEDASDSETITSILWESCRRQARPQISALAQRVDSAVGWDDLVLPAEQTEHLHSIAAHVRQCARVYQQWGFAARGGRGLGISALFTGASGTGKTMAAEVIANQLRLDLYKIDLSQVVSKYIGETEKNLRQIFDAAEAGGAILLFDEADALFGKRSDVKDSHDRYANIEVGYLLQRMEQYRGLAILTTNLRSAIDSAFLRRIRFVVNFPFPDAAQRVQIWQRAFPPATPTAGLDFERLARLNVAGGNIRNIVLGAAFLAADANEPVRMPHLLRATRAEYSKLEKTLTDSEVVGWGT